MKKRGVSYFRNYGSFFQDWEIAIAKKLVKKSCISSNMNNPDDFDDLLMECLAHWLLKRSKYNPNREASQKTFMAKVINNKLLDIAERQRTDKRKIDSLTDSLDEPIFDDSEAVTLLDKIDNKINHSPPLNLADQVELKRDLSKTLPNLTDRQRKICDLLRQGFNIQEISKYLGTPRSSVYDEINRIRAIFENKGLKIYLK